MTPKEQAELLYNKYAKLLLGKFTIRKLHEYPYSAKKFKNCVCFSLNELIKNTVCSSEFGGEETNNTYQYWKKVKKEFLKIHKLNISK